MHLEAHLMSAGWKMQVLKYRHILCGVVGAAGVLAAREMPKDGV